MGDDAARLLHEARHRAGISQAELARRAGTSQPAVSSYERGRKDPSVATLARLLSVTGSSLAAAEGPASTRDFLARAGWAAQEFLPDRLVDVAERVRAGEDVLFALREFLDGVGLVIETTEGAGVERLIAEVPARSGDDRADALLAAVAEHLAAVHGCARPAWATEPQRFLAVWWFPHRRRGFDALALRDSPAAFRRRGIFLSPSMLERV